MDKVNVDLYQQRNEPEILKASPGTYENLRTNGNVNLLETIDALLKGMSTATGKEYVLASWISPPFGRICGYGIYTRCEAQTLSERSKKERWGFPRFGSLYDTYRIEKRIEQIRLGNHVASEQS